MPEPFKVYVGYDSIDDKAFKVCSWSLRKHASIPVEVIPISDRILRQQEIYWRDYRCSSGIEGDEVNGQLYDVNDGRPFSTAGFSHARFGTPILAGYTDDLVLFTDPDMLWRRDVADLLDDAYVGKSLWCVHHDHTPPEERKMVGQVQTHYFRKNWSSFMLMRPSRCLSMTQYKLNHWSGGDLHGLRWLNDDEIGELPGGERWNWLEGWSDINVDPCVVHYTRGTPDMVGDDMPYSTEWWEAYREALTEEMQSIDLDGPKLKAV